MTSALKVRVGIEGGRRAVIAKARALGAPVLVSANSLWRPGRGFGGWQAYEGLDVALDSGGFVAMKRYGGFRWGVADYVKLAGAMRPSWWAQMDLCCEPELAGDAVAVAGRVSETARLLGEALRVADGEGVAAPMPVLQGWRPEEYCRGPIYEGAVSWPALVGVGSVCRRSVEGPCGLLRVMAALNSAVPAGVQFHLFGVKSSALGRLVEEYPHRLASVDSMAWNVEARWQAYRGERPGHSEARAEVMGEWYAAQGARLAAVRQLALAL